MDFTLDNINWSFIEEIEKDIQFSTLTDDFQLDTDILKGDLNLSTITESEMIDFEMPDIEEMMVDNFLNDAVSTEEFIVEEMNFGDQKITITIPILEKITEEPSTTSANKNFICLLCNLNFPNRFNLDRHFSSRKHLKNENVIVTSVEHIETTEEFFIEETADELDVISDHLNCKDCHKKFINAYQLKKHHQSVHRVFKCEKCARGFKSEKEFALHLERHQKSDNFQCSYCFKCFTNNTNLRRHEKVHLDSARKFECNFCKKNFNQKTNFVRHLRVHKDEIIVKN